MDYILKDGSVIEAPDSPTQEETMWLAANGAKPRTSVPMDVAKSGTSGLIEGAVRAPFIGSDLIKLGALGVNKLRPGTVGEERMNSLGSDAVLKALQDTPGAIQVARGKPFSSGLDLSLHQPQTTPGRYANTVGNAVGGLVLGGPGAFRSTAALTQPSGAGEIAKALMGRFMGSPVTQAAAVGGAAELAGDASRQFDESQDQNHWVKGPAAIATALAIALGSRLRQPSAMRPLYESTKGTTPAQWDAAMAETNRLRAAGATSNTIGDSLPPTSQIGAIERDISNSVGGQPLHEALVGRAVGGGDIDNLLSSAKGTIRATAAPGVDLRGIGDKELVGMTHGNRTASLRNILSNAPPVEDAALSRIVQALEARAGHPRNAGTVREIATRNAANVVENTPRYPLPQPPMPGPTSGPVPVTGGPGAPVPAGGIPQSALTAPRLALPAPPSTAVVPATQGGAVAPMQPPVGMMPPAQGSNFRFPNNQPITDVPGPMGANLEALSSNVKGLATVPEGTAAGPAARVLDKGSIKSAYRDTDRLLKAASPEYRAGMTDYARNSPRVELAQILADNKLNAIPNRVTASKGALDTRQAIAESLAKLDAQAAGQVGEKFHAADVLSRNTAERGMEGLKNQLMQSAGGTVLTPFQSFRNKFNLLSSVKQTKALSDMLANPTKENYDLLIKISKVDPTVARQLREMGFVGAVNAAAQTEGSQP